MALNGVVLTKTHHRVAESAEQDQTAHMCRLILLHTFRKLQPCSHTAGSGLSVLQAAKVWIGIHFG